MAIDRANPSTSCAGHPDPPWPRECTNRCSSRQAAGSRMPPTALAVGESALGEGRGLPRRLVPHVQEDQEEEGAHAPLQGQPRQAPEHGALTHRDADPASAARHPGARLWSTSCTAGRCLTRIAGWRTATRRRSRPGSRRRTSGPEAALDALPDRRGVAGPAGHPAGAARFDGRARARPIGCSHWSGAAARSSSRSSSAPPDDRRAGPACWSIPPRLVADATAAIDWYHPSPGRRAGRLRGLGGRGRAQRPAGARRATGQHRADEIPDTRAASVAWLPGDHAFLYARYPDGDEYNRHDLPPPPRPAVDRGRARLGRPADPRDLGRRRGLAGRPLTCWSRRWSGWSRTDLHLRDDRHRRVAHADRRHRRTTQARFDGDRLLAVTTLDAPRGRVVAIPLDERWSRTAWDDARARGRRRRAARRAGDRRHARRARR